MRYSSLLLFFHNMVLLDILIFGLELMGCVDGRDDELWDDFMEEVENMDTHLEIAIKILEKERK